MVGFAHSPSTISAVQEASEGTDILLKGSGTGVLCQKRLDPVPLRTGDDRLVSSLHHGPLATVQLLGPSVHGLPGCAALFHIPDVHLVFQHSVDGGIGPIGSFSQFLAVVVVLPVQFFVLAGTGNALCVQQLGNFNFAISLFIQVKHALNDGGGAGVDLQLVAVLRVLSIAIGGKGPDELSLLLL